MRIGGAAAAGVALLLLTVGSAARAEWKASGRDVPVERLVRNLERQIADHPDDAAAHAALARIQSMAWARGEEKIRVELPEDDETAVPGFLPWQSVKQRGSDQPLTEEREKRYRSSVLHYRKAVDLAPEDALYRLGLAYMLDDGSSFAAALGSPGDAWLVTGLPAEKRREIEVAVRRLASEKEEERQTAAEQIRRAFPAAFPVLVETREDEDETVRGEVGGLLEWYWRGFALEQYHAAFDLAVQKDLEAESFCMEGDAAVSFEAGRAILRLSKGRSLDEKAREKLVLVQEAVAELDEKPRWITPLVVPFGSGRTLASLVHSDRTVSFDLDGDGEPGRWPWLGPDAGLLVWDPDRTGRVRSGLDLFGSVTWWTFWRHGFEPLAALDDDGDGRLEGAELDGISVWRDANGDAVSDPGEVVSASAAGIRSIAVRPGMRLEGVPAHEAGVRMADGSTRPLFDWTPRRR